MRRVVLGGRRVAGGVARTVGETRRGRYQHDWVGQERARVGRGWRRTRILVINPNTSAEFTEVIRGSLPSREGPVEVRCVEAAEGPETLESFYDEVLSTPATLRLLLEEDYDGAVIACFSDHPAVQAGREISKRPIVGLFEAACTTAAFLGDKIGVATTSRSWVPLLRQSAERRNFPCVVRSVDGRVADAASMRDELLEVSRRLVQDDGADVVVLGCAGFAGLVDDVGFSGSLDVPVVEPVRAAYEICKGLCNQRLSTSKHTLYATPLYKPIKGFQASDVFLNAYRTSRSDSRQHAHAKVDFSASPASPPAPLFQDPALSSLPPVSHHTTAGDGDTVLAYEDYFATTTTSSPTRKYHSISAAEDADASTTTRQLPKTDDTTDYDLMSDWMSEV